jgi:cell division protein FtsB
LDARLKEEKVIDERLRGMPYVHADYGKMPSYAIFRVGRKYKSIPLVKGFIKHMTREAETPNSDPERLKNNEQIYGVANLYEDTKEYLEDCKMHKNSVVGREILLTSSPQFFKGMLTKDFNTWIDINLQWLKDTFKDNFRAAYLHLDETSPHIHALVIPKLMNEKIGKFTLQNYKYFNGYEMLRNLQDDYAESMQKKFPELNRGIKGSKRKHIEIKKFYSIMGKNNQESNIETLQAKAAHEEMLKMKVNYMDKTLKSFQHFNRQHEEENQKLQQENEKLQKQIEELKKNVYDKEETLQNNNKKTAKRGFSGKRYNKSV